MSGKRIMSGEYSSDMWDAINSAKTMEDLRDTLYLICCRLQELEGRFVKYSETELSETKQDLENVYGVLDRSEKRLKRITDKFEEANRSAACWKKTAGMFKAELVVTEDLLAERDKLLGQIPACPVHGGQCVSHAIEWVKARLREESQCEYVCR